MVFVVIDIVVVVVVVVVVVDVVVVSADIMKTINVKVRMNKGFLMCSPFIMLLSSCHTLNFRL